MRKLKFDCLSAVDDTGYETMNEKTVVDIPMFVSCRYNYKIG